MMKIGLKERFKLKSWRLPKTFWGFPVADGDQGEGTGGDPKQRGIALIIAIMIISIMMLFTSDLILSSQVNITLATQARDNLKAEYMAKSGLNVATLLLSSDFAYHLFQAQQDPKATLSTGFGDIWSIMNGLPIGGESAEMLSAFQDQFNLNALMDEGVLDGLKLFEGAFTVDVSDESQKINVNNCFYGRCQETMLMLEALFACPAEKAFLDNKKVTGRELAFRIKDYITSQARADEASGFNDKNEPYQSRNPKQMAKNAPLDSVDELRMVEGWDNDLQAIFAPYITTFPFQAGSTDTKFQMNINTASRELLQCLFPESKGDCQEKSTLALKKRADDQAQLGSAGAKIADVLKDTLCYTGGDGKDGEANNRASWFTQNSNIYRVEVEGTVGNSVKKLTAVIERYMPDVKKNEKSTYRILYWKVI